MVDIGARGLRLTVAEPTGRAATRAATAGAPGTDTAGAPGGGWFRPVAHRTVALPLWRALLADRPGALGAAELAVETVRRLLRTARRHDPARTILLARSDLAGKPESALLLDGIAAAVGMAVLRMRPVEEARMTVQAVAAGTDCDGFVLACEADAGTVRVGVASRATVVWATAVDHLPHARAHGGQACALTRALLPWSEMAPPRLAVAGGDTVRSAAVACIAATVDLATTTRSHHGLHAGMVLRATRGVAPEPGHHDLPVPSWHVHRVATTSGAPPP